MESVKQTHDFHFHKNGNQSVSHVQCIKKENPCYGDSINVALQLSRPFVSHINQMSSRPRDSSQQVVE